MTDDAKVCIMTKAATPFRVVAWLVLSLVLFGGLACSLGHGRLLAAYVLPAPVSQAMSSRPDCGDHRHMENQAAISDHQPNSRVPLHIHEGADSTCVFAGTLLLALALSALGWWLGRSGDRHRRRLPPRSSYTCHHVLIALNPQAP